MSRSQQLSRRSEILSQSRGVFRPTETAGKQTGTDEESFETSGTDQSRPGLVPPEAYVQITPGKGILR